MEFSPENLERFGETPMSLLGRLWRHNDQVWRIGENATQPAVSKGQLSAWGCNLGAAKTSEIGYGF